MNARLVIGPTRIGMQLGSTSHALMTQAWRTRHGLLFCEDGDRAPDPRDCAEIVGALSLHDDPPWEPSDRTPLAAALEHASLPRAVRWAVALRALAELTGAEIEAADIVVAELADASAARDAARAVTLLGWQCESLASLSPAELALLSQWRQRRPWCDLRLVESDRSLIARGAPLPARARFGRVFIDADGVSAIPDPPQLRLGDEALAAAPPFDPALPGAHEYEVCWKADGSLALDLLIDDTWRPWPAGLPITPASAAHLEAAALYAALEYWSETLSATNAAVLDVIAAATTVNA